MKKVFISGSRRISRLPAEVQSRLDEMIRRELMILIGDANGADKAIQTYFAEQRYPNVLVFCTAGHCRNNIVNWPVRSIDAPHRARDFAFFTAKDAAMAKKPTLDWRCGTGAVGRAEHRHARQRRASRRALETSGGVRGADEDVLDAEYA
jgi:hypothetical protein